MTSTSRLRLGVLASGSGTNLQALLDACASGALPAEVAAVIVNVPGARALERARAAGVPALLEPHQGFGTRQAYDAHLVEILRRHRVELVCLAGYMRIVSTVMLEAFPDKVLNIHPSLLPSFPGLHAQRQALEAGVRVSGCTVHVVDQGCDTGPIVMQAAVPVLEGDDEASLTARILVHEHRCYLRAVRLCAEGRIEIVREGGTARVRVRANAGPPEAFVASPPYQDPR